MRIITYLIFYICLGYTCASDSKIADPKKPTVFIFSTEYCPACLMMKPVVAKLKEEYKNRFYFDDFEAQPERRRQMLFKFIRKVEMRYVPTFVIADPVTHGILAHVRGYVPLEDFKEILKGAEKKYQVAKTLKLSKMLLLCKTDNTECKSWKTSANLWKSNKNGTDIKLETVVLSKIKSEKDWEVLKEKLSNLKYLSALEFFPNIIATTTNDEVIEQIHDNPMYQLPMSKERLDAELNHFLAGK
jgi:thiol-disulfide isomerase/thioredoxin